MATHSSILAWRIPWIEVGYSPLGSKESDMNKVTWHARIKPYIEAPEGLSSLDGSSKNI